MVIMAKTIRQIISNDGNVKLAISMLQNHEKRR